MAGLRLTHGHGPQGLSGFLGNLGWTAASLLDRVLLVASVQRERHTLGGLDERLLADIGVDRGRAATEAARPFWDVPPERR
jgi:uncharacterized protein YjiS (DUF1127 family)